MINKIGQSERTFIQFFFLDPLVAFCALLFWIIFSVLPVGVASKLGGIIGGFIGRFAKNRNHIALVNMRIAFPEKTAEERHRILKNMWCHWGRFYAEMPHGKELYRTGVVKGLEHFKKTVASGKGGFVCSAHFGNWEPVVSVPLFDSFYLNPVYRKANNPWLEKLMFQRRKGILIPKGIQGARKLIDVIRHKGFVAILCDQKLREGISVPFFGKPAMTPSAIATIALRMNVPIFMARSVRQDDGRFLFEIKPLDLSVTDSSNAEFEIMSRINHIYEDWIRENPEQWLWIHRRFDKSEYK